MVLRASGQNCSLDPVGLNPLEGAVMAVIARAESGPMALFLSPIKTTVREALSKPRMLLKLSQLMRCLLT